MQRERSPRREVLKHRQAEERLRRAFLEGRNYVGMAEDIALVKRKQRELGPERLRRVVEGGGA
jgi:hypothetical protein